MRLSGRVMSVLKGVGGAVVLVGCAASQPEPVTPVVNTPVILSTETEVEPMPVVVVKPRPVQPEQPVQPVEPIFPDYPDVHPACGRG